MRLLAATLLFFCLPCTCVLAQDSTPDFRCIISSEGQDSLVWVNQPIDCGGTYEATEIFRRGAGDDTVIQVGETTDPLATGLAVPSDGSVYFYFICYRITGCGFENCSRELRSGSLAPPEFVHVSVEGGSLFVRWQPSSSPQVSSYTIFEDDGIDLLPVGTVSGTEFEIPGLSGPFEDNPELAARRFLVVSSDDCGNLSPRSAIVSGIEGILRPVDPCTAQVDVSADPLNTIQTPLYRVFVSVDGGPYEPNERQSWGIYTDLPIGSEACFYVETQPEGFMTPIRSTTICTIVTGQQINDVPIELYGVEVGDDGILGFRFNPATAPPDNPELFVEQLVEGGEVLRGSVGPADLALAFNPLPLSPIGGMAAGRYRFETVDACGRELTSNEVAPVVLEGRSLVPSRNFLSWTELVNGLPGPTVYDVFRVDTSGAESLIAAGLLNREFTDQVSGRSGTICYRIVARYAPEDGSGELPFRSNLVCLSPELAVFFPNALHPASNFDQNRRWRPLFNGDFSGTGYELRIFSRWGALVFETDDPLLGWEGMSTNGEPAAPGVYVFALSYTDQRGRSVVRAGDINLLR